jgi:hypothetical protein
MPEFSRMSPGIQALVTEILKRPIRPALERGRSPSAASRSCQPRRTIQSIRSIGSASTGPDGFQLALDQNPCETPLATL